MPPEVGGVEEGDIGEEGVGATGAGTVGTIGAVEHPALAWIALLTVLDQSPLTSSWDTQKKAPPLHA